MKIEIISDIESFLPLIEIRDSKVVVVNKVDDDKNQEKIGAGFGDPETNQEVEQAAVSFVTNDYKRRGWLVESVEAKKCGYDLLCTNDQFLEHVEVKGIQGDLVSFIITAGEVRQSQSDDFFVLYAVTSALSTPKLHRFTAKEFHDKFGLETLSYRALLRQK